MALRSEYPRPHFVRNQWQTLNGPWFFAFDDRDQGIVQEWFRNPLPNGVQIEVPFCYQSPYSGVNIQEVHEIVWYQREFTLPPEWEGKGILLHFGAVDYHAIVWINGHLAGENKGGYASFTLDIAPFLCSGANTITVRVVDRPLTSQPRGKQKARYENFGCWYTPVTGIWQSVWLEAVGGTYLDHVRMVPDIDKGTLCIDYWLSGFEPGLTLKCDVSLDGQQVASLTTDIEEKHTFFSDIIPRRDGVLTLEIPDAQLWWPESPVLYDVKFTLLKGSQVLDEVQTYAGMRKVHAENGKIYLNNEPYYLRMILDQGFWPEGVYTPPSIDAIRYDVEMTKAFGFNGARKHQKFEDPYYYYFCDKLGLLAWCEMPAPYIYDEELCQNITSEWQQLVIQHYNHPSVMAWVPVNESWGVDQLTRKEFSGDPRLVHYLITLYHLTKCLDPTRLVVGNDGWHQAVTDIIAIHDYTQDADDLRRKYAAFKEDRHTSVFTHGNQILLDGFPYQGQPIMITEYGGVKAEEQGAEGWGYGESAKSYEEMLERMAALTQVILDEDEICGFCYTQLTDVEQEVNGLMTYDRKPKVDPDRFKAIFGVDPER
ncbi:MAG: glycoside hydrolase family 2 [Firmicutes bacterium]|nr:glycoside hydrolase family 2 [Bacillota bacterium]